MYIVNQRGILHTWPDDQAAPAKSRPATEHEIACFLATGEQDTARMPLPTDEKDPAKGKK